jgi:guanylate kinase
VGKAIIFSAPSGAGKTTLVRSMLEKFPVLSFSVSATNRSRREGETEGKDYYFISTEAFQEAVRNNRFVEYEEVYSGNFYGTFRAEVERIWQQGKVVIFDVDVVGGLSLKRQFQDDALSIFVKAPSVEVIENRLRQRKTESDEKIAIRLAKAESEMQYAVAFDKILLNDELELALARATEMIAEFLLSSNHV